MPSRGHEPSQTIDIPDPLDDRAVASVRGALEREPPPAALTVDLRRVRRIDPEALRRLARLVQDLRGTRVAVTGVTIGVAGQLLHLDDGRLP